MAQYAISKPLLQGLSGIAEIADLVTRERIICRIIGGSQVAEYTLDA